MCIFEIAQKVLVLDAADSAQRTATRSIEKTVFGRMVDQNSVSKMSILPFCTNRQSRTNLIVGNAHN